MSSVKIKTSLMQLSFSLTQTLDNSWSRYRLHILVLVGKTICKKFIMGSILFSIVFDHHEVSLTSSGEFLLYSQIELLIPSSWGRNSVFESKPLIRKECGRLNCFKL